MFGGLGDSDHNAKCAIGDQSLKFAAHVNSITLTGGTAARNVLSTRSAPKPGTMGDIFFERSLCNLSGRILRDGREVIIDCPLIG